MMILFYSADTARCAERLWPVVAAAALRSGVKRYRTLRGFVQALRQPGRGGAIAVLAVTDMEELERFVSLRELLWNLRIILVLPDDDPASVAAGHLLRPRLATHWEGRLAEISAVLGRMVEQGDRGENQENICKRG